MNRVAININPLILRWAREEAGYIPSEIASKVDVSADRYIQWEREGKNIPLGKLKIIANSYKRQLAVFLLPIVPDKIIKPKDFRNLSPADSILSKKTLEVFRDVNYFIETAIEIRGRTYWENRYDWMNSIEGKTSNSDELNEILRELLNVSIEDQLNWQSDNEAYRKWRLAIEDRLGIFIFQFAIPMNEVHGFCMTGNLPYAIVTNSNHSYTGRIFTIFHELAHIIKRQSGICLYEKATKKQEEEWNCNLFAGNFLVPKNLIEETDDLKLIARYASKIKVSREVYLRRLKEERKISDIIFFNLLDQIKSTYRTEKKKSGFIKPVVKSKASRGETFYNMILEAMYQNQISYSKASNALDLNISTLLNEV